MKILLKSIPLLVLTLSVSKAQPKPIDSIYSYKFEKVELAIFPIVGYNFWTKRKGKMELVLTIKDSHSTSVSYGICGLICGILIEGIATRPSDVVIQIGSRNDQWVKFSERSKFIIIQINGKKLQIDRDEAKRLIQKLTNYWCEQEESK